MFFFTLNIIIMYFAVTYLGLFVSSGSFERSIDIAGIFVLTFRLE